MRLNEIKYIKKTNKKTLSSVPSRLEEVIIIFFLILGFLRCN